jgi:hypothetical protein
MTTLYVLDIDDFRPLAQVAAKNPEVTVTKRGPYLEVHAAAAFDIDRNATGCRNAVWYSSVAAIRGGVITVWDKNTMTLAPSDLTSDSASAARR